MRKDENWRQEKEEMKVSMAKLEQLNQKLQSFASPAQPLVTKLREVEDALSEKEARMIGMQDQEITMQHDFEAKTERKQESFNFLLDQAKKESERFLDEQKEEAKDQVVRYVHLKQQFEKLEASEKWYREAYEYWEDEGEKENAEEEVEEVERNDGKEEDI